MKRFLIFVFAICGLQLANVAHAEVIRSFDVQATLDASRTLTVTETITYDFEDAERHGIYRDIPVVYERNGANFRLRLSVDDSTMDGQPVDQVVSSEGDALRIRLGDADQTITGRHTYVIRYSTDRAINDFSEEKEKELYWNVTGNGWTVPIEKASMTVDGPVTATKTICFTGAYGSAEEECKITSDASRVTVRAKNVLGPTEGLTLAIRYPASSMRDIPWTETLWDLIFDNIWLGIPVIVFCIMLGVWHRYGKDPFGRGTVIAHYEEPRNLPPALLAGLIDQELSQRAITATILDLARRGYLKLKFTGEMGGGWFSKSPEFTLIKEKNADERMLAFERTLFDGLFEDGDETDLKSKKDGSFWKDIQKAREQAFEELQSRGLFGKNPGAVRGTWLAIAGGIAFFGWIFIPSALGIFTAIVSALIIAGFGWHMPTKTKEGAIVMEEAEGFKLFLSVTERDRLDFTDAPERKPDQFARFLPAAVAFGVEEKWGKQFAGIHVQPPSYMDGNMAGWNALQFANLSHALHDQSVSGMYKQPASAGGGGSGFSGGGSGGGFGGGGGGSW